MKILIKISFIAYLTVALLSTSSHAISVEKVQKIFDAACQYFESMDDLETVYKTATAFKKGEALFEAGSISSIVYATVGFSRVVKLQKQNLLKAFESMDEEVARIASEGIELSLKAGYNLALMLCATGRIGKARQILEACAKDGFKPAAKSLHVIDATLARLKTSILPSDGDSEDDSGTIDRNYIEEVSEALINAGVVRLRLSAEERALSVLEEEDLAELSRVAKKVEKRVAFLDDACILLVGRSPLLLGMMLQERGLVKACIVRVPFSGLKQVAEDQQVQSQQEEAYLSFLSDKVPKATNYVVIDSCDSASTFRNFLRLMGMCGVSVQKVHPMALVDEMSSHVPDDIEPLIVKRATLSKMIQKGLISRTLCLPGIGFFPRHWCDAAYRKRVLEFEALEATERPMVAVYREQMADYVQRQGIVIRDLLAYQDAASQGPGLYGMGAIIAAVVLGRTISSLLA